VMRFGVGDAFIEQPGVHLVIGLESQGAGRHSNGHVVRKDVDAFDDSSTLDGGTDRTGDISLAK
jgi:hypothetical protein